MDIKPFAEDHVGGYLGTIMGAAIGALTAMGHTAEDLHKWLDISIKVAKSSQADPDKVRPELQPLIDLAMREMAAMGFDVPEVKSDRRGRAAGAPGEGPE